MMNYIYIFDIKRCLIYNPIKKYFKSYVLDA